MVYGKNRFRTENKPWTWDYGKLKYLNAVCIVNERLSTWKTNNFVFNFTQNSSNKRGNIGMKPSMWSSIQCCHSMWCEGFKSKLLLWRWIALRNWSSAFDAKSFNLIQLACLLAALLKMSDCLLLIMWLNVVDPTRFNLSHRTEMVIKPWIHITAMNSIHTKVPMQLDTAGCRCRLI